MYPYPPQGSYGPYAGYHHGMNFARHGRGPRRFFWFVLGGLAAAWWLRSKDRREYQRSIEASSSQADSPHHHHHHEHSGHGGWGWGWQDKKQSEAKWEAEKEKFKKFKTEASDTIIDATEASLETVLGAVESLKKRLAEQRAERERAKEANPNDEEPLHRV